MAKANKIKTLREKSMTKKSLDEYNKAQRMHIEWNTGSRVHKSAKDYNRQAVKQATRKAIYE